LRGSKRNDSQSLAKAISPTGEGVNHIYIGEQPFNYVGEQPFNSSKVQQFNDSENCRSTVQKFNE
jgi:hypothetical protein